MKLATTTGDLLYYSESPAQAVRAFEGTGFKHLDYSFWRAAWDDKPILKNDWMNDVISASKEAEKLGFDFVQAHSPGNNPFDDDYEEVVTANKRAIEACGYLGINKIVIHTGVIKDLHFADGKDFYFRKNKEFYERLLPTAEKYNVKILAENYPRKPDTEQPYLLCFADALNDFIAYCNHPLLGVCWDTGHGNISVPSAYDQIVELGDNLEALHVQDNFGVNDNHLAPYMGTLDIDSLMHGLIDSGYAKRDCYFTFECDNIISRNSADPKDRNYDERFEKKASLPNLELKRAAVRFMYEIGKNILTEYNCFDG